MIEGLCLGLAMGCFGTFTAWLFYNPLENEDREDW